MILQACLDRSQFFPILCLRNLRYKLARLGMPSETALSPFTIRFSGISQSSWLSDRQASKSIGC